MTLDRLTGETVGQLQSTATIPMAGRRGAARRVRVRPELAAALVTRRRAVLESITRSLGSAIERV
ncbi:hypothetical protein CTI14_42620, partial [Methylobacterium radiotolerans]